MRSEVIKGLSKLQRRLTEADFVAPPAGAFLRDWREDLRSEAVKRAPRWRGGIIDALMSAQDTHKFPLWARVFADAPEARWSEYGTGELSVDPKSTHQRYFPPPGRVRDWAEDHGRDAYAVARGIYNRGGTEPTYFFSDAERAADTRFNAKISRFGRDIEREAGRNV